VEQGARQARYILDERKQKRMWRRKNSNTLQISVPEDDEVVISTADSQVDVRMRRRTIGSKPSNGRRGTKMIQSFIVKVGEDVIPQTKGFRVAKRNCDAVRRGLCIFLSWIPIIVLCLYIGFWLWLTLEVGRQCESGLKGDEASPCDTLPEILEAQGLSLTDNVRWDGSCRQWTDLLPLVQRAADLPVTEFVGEVSGVSLAGRPTIDLLSLELNSCYQGKAMKVVFVTLHVLLFVLAFCVSPFLGKKVHEEKESQTLRPILDLLMEASRAGKEESDREESGCTESKGAFDSNISIQSRQFKRLFKEAAEEDTQCQHGKNFEAYEHLAIKLTQKAYDVLKDKDKTGEDKFEVPENENEGSESENISEKGGICARSALELVVENYIVRIKGSWEMAARVFFAISLISLTTAVILFILPFVTSPARGELQNGEFALPGTCFSIRDLLGNAGSPEVLFGGQCRFWNEFEEIFAVIETTKSVAGELSQLSDVAANVEGLGSRSWLRTYVQRTRICNKRSSWVPRLQFFKVTSVAIGIPSIFAFFVFSLKKRRFKLWRWFKKKLQEMIDAAPSLFRDCFEKSVSKPLKEKIVEPGLHKGRSVSRIWKNRRDEAASWFSSRNEDFWEHAQHTSNYLSSFEWPHRIQSCVRSILESSGHGVWFVVVSIGFIFFVLVALPVGLVLAAILIVLLLVFGLLFVLVWPLTSAALLVQSLLRQAFFVVAKRFVEFCPNCEAEGVFRRKWGCKDHFCSKHRQELACDICDDPSLECIHRKRKTGCRYCFCSKHRQARADPKVATYCFGFWRRNLCGKCPICADPCPKHQYRLRTQCKDCFCTAELCLKPKVCLEAECATETCDLHTPLVCPRCRDPCENHPGKFKRNCKCWCRTHGRYKIPGENGCLQCLEPCEICKLEKSSRHRSLRTLSLQQRSSDSLWRSFCGCFNARHDMSKDKIEPQVSPDEEMDVDLVDATEECERHFCQEHRKPKICQHGDFSCPVCNDRCKFCEKFVNDKCLHKPLHECQEHFCMIHQRYRDEDTLHCLLCDSPCKVCEQSFDIAKWSPRTECPHFCQEHNRYHKDSYHLVNGENRCPQCTDHCPFQNHRKLPVPARKECPIHWCRIHERSQPCSSCRDPCRERQDHVQFNEVVPKRDECRQHWCPKHHKPKKRGEKCEVGKDPCFRCLNARVPLRELQTRTNCGRHYCRIHDREKIDGSCLQCDSPCKRCKGSESDVSPTVPATEECKQHWCQIHNREALSNCFGECLICHEPCCHEMRALSECPDCFCSVHQEPLCGDECANGFCSSCTCLSCGKSIASDAPEGKCLLCWCAKHQEVIHDGHCPKCENWCSHSIPIRQCDECSCSKHDKRRSEDGRCPDCVQCVHGEIPREECSICFCEDHDRDACEGACPQCFVIVLPLTSKRFAKFAAKLHNLLLQRNLISHTNRKYLSWENFHYFVTRHDNKIQSPIATDSISHQNYGKVDVEVIRTVRATAAFLQRGNEHFRVVHRGKRYTVGDRASHMSQLATWKCAGIRTCIRGGRTMEPPEIGETPVYDPPADIFSEIRSFPWWSPHNEEQMKHEPVYRDFLRVEVKEMATLTLEKRPGWNVSDVSPIFSESTATNDVRDENAQQEKLVREMTEDLYQWFLEEPGSDTDDQ